MNAWVVELPWKCIVVKKARSSMASRATATTVFTIRDFRLPATRVAAPTRAAALLPRATVRVAPAIRRLRLLVLVMYDGVRVL